VTRRDRRALRTGGAVVGLAVVLLRLGPWGWKAGHAAHESLQARVELLGRMRADLQDAGRLQDHGAEVRRDMAALASTILSPRTESEAVAALGAIVTLVAERQHVRISRTDVLPDSRRAGAARRVGIRLGLESDTAGLLGLLDGLARVPEALVVDEVRVAAEARSDPAGGAGPEMLHTELAVRGWYLPGETPR
jgi:hypothetical protein